MRIVEGHGYYRCIRFKSTFRPTSANLCFVVVGYTEESDVASSADVRRHSAGGDDICPPISARGISTPRSGASLVTSSSCSIPLHGRQQGALFLAIYHQILIEYTSFL